MKRYSQVGKLGVSKLTLTIPRLTENPEIRILDIKSVILLPVSINLLMLIPPLNKLPSSLPRFPHLKVSVYIVHHFKKEAIPIEFE